MKNWVSTWFYTQSKEEGGDYAQVRGDSSTEPFRDVYRRCLGVFFLSARKANPDAELVLYLNTPWHESSSQVASEVWRLLQSLNVAVEVIQYKHQPPLSFAKSWKNQFFVLDVLFDLSNKVAQDDAWVILDSDIVWSTQSTDSLWQALRAGGTSTYTVGYELSQPVNGLSIKSLGELGDRAGLKLGARLEYSGGEFVGGNGSSIMELSDLSHAVWTLLMAEHESSHEVQFEEAHLLSLAYSVLGVEPGAMNGFIRRLWTQPFKYQNVVTDDAKLSLWHVPAEKKYGLRRLYRTIASDYRALLTMENAQWVSECQQQLGIPVNSLLKITRDTTRAIRSRAAARVARAARSSGI
jgi:hypothetical protein